MAYKGRSVMSNSANAQQLRVYEYLQVHKRLTTLEAREKLDVLHPAARVQELRAAGLNIVTEWRLDFNGESPHRVAEYVLLLGKPADGGAEK